MTTVWRYTITLNPATHGDVIAYLDACPNKAEAIREGIRRLVDDDAKQDCGEAI